MISCLLFVFLFCVTYSVGAKWEPMSWTDCVYTLSSALGDACHATNALCWLCVWHSYITNTSHWGPQSRDYLSFCLPENGKNQPRGLRAPSFSASHGSIRTERQRQEKDRRERMLGVERKRRRTRRVVGLS